MILMIFVKIIEVEYEVDLETEGWSDYNSNDPNDICEIDRSGLHENIYEGLPIQNFFFEEELKSLNVKITFNKE